MRLPTSKLTLLQRNLRSSNRFTLLSEGEIKAGTAWSFRMFTPANPSTGGFDCRSSPVGECDSLITVGLVKGQTQRFDFSAYKRGGVIALEEEKSNLLHVFFEDIRLFQSVAGARNFQPGLLQTCERSSDILFKSEK
jgi:hypothetical protein